MNKFEKMIYDLVRFQPQLKHRIVATYQRIFSIFPSKDLRSTYPITIRQNYFFGFHDKCPWSHDDKYLLAHKCSFDGRLPEKEDEAEIGYFTERNQSTFQSIAKTNALNWQTGSMLQWIGKKDQIIFNYIHNGLHVAKIVERDGKLVKELPFPVAGVSPDGHYMLSHSFNRLRKAAPAYGYAFGEEDSMEAPMPKDSGLILMDLKENKHKMMFSIQDIAKFDANYESGSNYHYFSHCLFSPDGKRFAFYHRWLNSNGQTWTRLFTSDLNGMNVKLHNFSGVVTHCAWRDTKSLLVYAFKKETKDHYYLLNDNTGKSEIIGRNDFTSDGHPQFSPSGDTFVTDTYPDRRRRQLLILYDMKEKKRYNIAVVRSPLNFTGDIRCDLHPRWNRKGTLIAFDSAHTGVRSLCTLSLRLDSL